MDFSYIIIDNKYENIKQILKLEFGFSDRLILKLKTNQRIYLNDTICYINSPIHIGDTIKVNIDFEEDNSNIVPTKMNLDIAYEDDYMLIINKAANSAIHPSQLHFDNSLSNGVKFYFDLIGLNKKIRPVNRLDKDTSGLVIFAKNDFIQDSLSNQMQAKIFKKDYIAILDGILDKKKGTINAPIARENDSIIKRCIRDDGAPSITHYEVLDISNTNNLSLVKFNLETGRTHQIRVHTSFIGHPILGDTLYGKESSLISRQALHSYKVSFFHPVLKKNMIVQIDLPNDMKKIKEECF